MKEAVTGFGDKIIEPNKKLAEYNDNPFAGTYKQVGYVHDKFFNRDWNITWENYYYIYNDKENDNFEITYPRDRATYCKQKTIQNYTPPDTSKSPPTAYCFSQLKQGTYLIRLKSPLR